MPDVLVYKKIKNDCSVTKIFPPYESKPNCMPNPNNSKPVKINPKITSIFACSSIFAFLNALPIRYFTTPLNPPKNSFCLSLANGFIILNKVDSGSWGFIVAVLEQKVGALKLSWSNSNQAGLIFILLYTILALVPTALAFAYKPNSDDPLTEELAFGCGLTGFAIISLQVAMGSRLKFLDQAFGLDAVMIFHKRMAVFATLLLLMHPVLLSIGLGNISLLGFGTPWQVNLGKAALLLLVLNVLFSLFFPKLRVDYNNWRIIHKAMIFVVVIGFIHSINIGEDLEYKWLRIYWWTLFVIMAGLFSFRNFLFPFAGRKKFTVKSIQRQSWDTYTLHMAPDNGKLFGYKPGQFMFLELQKANQVSQEHPFTISSSPANRDDLTVTIKKSGNYTDNIDQTMPGEKALVEAPFGRFSIAFTPKARSFLFIAGGVGITPIHSIILFLRQQNDSRQVRLIFGNKQEKDILFREELESCPQNFKIFHVLSKPEKNWTGLSGHINGDVITKCASDVISEAEVFLCGPPGMMKTVIAELNGLGIPDRRIHYERFTI